MAVNEVTAKTAEHRLQVKLGESEDCATFILGDQDHTLGNALRHVLMQTRGTEFCGYSIPHPSEPYVHLRLQTQDGTSAAEKLKAGLKELSVSCDHIEAAFDRAFDDFEKKQMDE
uniref:DNA-directed RNA polymerase RBP11-like dimerisation domain-containing protein n=1 Tax=Rhizochromulina marina TaxID=1034831 RepID=A0A7S2WKX3_9STRA